LTASARRRGRVLHAAALVGLLLGCADAALEPDPADAARPARGDGIGYVYGGPDAPAAPPDSPDPSGSTPDLGVDEPTPDEPTPDEPMPPARDAALPGAPPPDAPPPAEERFDAGPVPPPPPIEGGGDPPPPAPPPEPEPVVCNPIRDGLATVAVNGDLRLFSVQMPADTSRMAILFLWHGFLEWPDTFRNEIVFDVPSGRWVAFDPNAFPMPLMIVTPWDTKMIPPWGLDWDIVSGAVDLPFFDAMLQCIREQYAIDDSRIYSFGFSAGAVFSNLLASIYPDLFAATISESGAWFNDPAQWADVLVPIIEWQWPALNPADRGSVLLTHGGPNDFATVISLESANQKALPFLRDHGRTVLECAHGFGHTRAPDLTQRMYYDYMWAHQRGGPPTGGLPPGFPTPERPIGSTGCVLHPPR
jgi:predicted esterase